MQAMDMKQFLFSLLFTFSITLFSVDLLAELEMPYLVSPENNTTNYDLSSHTIKWTKSDGAENYIAQFSRNDGFTDIALSVEILAGDLPDTGDTLEYSFSDILEFGTDYYWRITSFNPTNTSDWSPVWMFSTIELFPPDLSGNANDSVPVLDFKHDWNNQKYVDSYQYQLSASSSFSDLLVDYEITPDTTYTYDTLIVADTISNIDTSFTVSEINQYKNAYAGRATLDYDTQYFIRAKAMFREQESPWSVSHSFTSGTISELRPYQISPENNSSDVSVNPDLKWFWNHYTEKPWHSGSSQSAKLTHPGPEKSYLVGTILQLDTIINSSSKTYSIEAVPARPDFETVYSIKDIELEYSSTYFWRIILPSNTFISQEPLTTDSSLVWMFTTLDDILVPQLSLPANDSENINPINISLDWTNTSFGDNFDVQISADENFADILSEDNLENVNSLNKNLEYNKMYFWRVRATNSKRTSDWSTVFSFMTGSRDSFRPMLTFPENDQVLLSTSVSMSWTDSEDYNSVNIDIDTSPKFDSESLQTSAISLGESSFDGFVLEMDEQYFWRIRVAKDNNVLDTSLVWNFTIAKEIVATRLVQPADEETDVKRQPTYIWNPVEGATSYSLNVSKDENFPEDETSKFGISADYTKISPNTTLDYSSTFYWKVITYGYGEQTKESEVFSFTTEFDTYIGEHSDFIFNIYPSPSSEFLMIESEIKSTLDIKLINLNGKEVISFKMNGNKKVNISNLPKASYLLNIFDGDNLIRTEKIIKK
jgi:Secretion system C-terminal sorting domain